MHKQTEMETASSLPTAPQSYHYPTASPQPLAPPHPPPSKPASSMLFRIGNLISRILAAIFLLIGLVVLAVDTITLDDGSTAGFGSVISYRYTFSVVVIGFLYTLVQIGFGLYRLITGAHSGKVMLIIDFFGDKVLSYLLLSGAAAGFGAAIDMKRTLIGVDEFFNKGNAATSLVFMASLFSIGSSIISSLVVPKCSSCN